MEPADRPDDPDRTDHDLAASARGWQRVQLAVLGFIGLCGVLWAGGDSPAPDWMQWLAGVLAVLALILAIVASYLVGRVAHPFRGPAAGTEAVGSGNGATQLRRGVAITYVAVVVLVVATLSAWFPRGDEPSAAVEVQDTAGQAWCGELIDGPAGTVRLDTADGTVTVRVDGIAQVRPVGRC